MPTADLGALLAGVARVEIVRSIGRIVALNEATLTVAGLSDTATLGDGVRVRTRDGRLIDGEVLALSKTTVEVLPTDAISGASIGDQVSLRGAIHLSPDESWIGRVVDPFGKPLDDRPLIGGAKSLSVHTAPPAATKRRPLGERLETGLAAFNTFLPIVKGQRIGLFAGSGVGKSTLLAGLARGLEADLVVIGLVGERGREVRHFVEQVLGPDGMARAIAVAATSDQSPISRRRCALSAMTVAEYFRDQGLHVLLLVDSITRFAEAHREIALATGEAASMKGFPPSLSHQIMSLAERAGPGEGSSGDITAIFSVLVAGSDMEGPVADTLRGVLDGHVVLDRDIAERGRYPAIDLLRSVSRSLPEAASPEENKLIARGRELVAAYERAELMIQSGLYAKGSDPIVDQAIRYWQELDSFIGETAPMSAEESFEALAACISDEKPA